MYLYMVFIWDMHTLHVYSVYTQSIGRVSESTIVYNYCRNWIFLRLKNINVVSEEKIIKYLHLLEKKMLLKIIL